MTLPLQTQLLIEQSLEKVRNHPYHYLTPDDRTAIYNSFGPIREEIELENANHFLIPTKAIQVFGWLAVLTARKVLSIWDDRTRETPFPCSSESDEILREMLKTAEGVLVGDIPAEIAIKELCGRFYDFQTGIDRNTIWPTYHSLCASYNALNAVATGSWNIDYVVENTLIAYSGIDLNPPGVISLIPIDYSSFLSCLELVEIDEELQISIQEWIEWNEELGNDWSDFKHRITQEAKVFIPLSVDLPKSLEFWEWWLTEAIPQAWELAQTD